MHVSLNNRSALSGDALIIENIKKLTYCYRVNGLYCDSNHSRLNQFFGDDPLEAISQ